MEEELRNCPKTPEDIELERRNYLARIIGEAGLPRYVKPMEAEQKT